jgi:hypothetical protein
MPTPEKDAYLQKHFNVDFTKRATASASAGPTATAAVTKGAPSAPKPAAKKKPLSDHELLTRMEDRERGHTKVDIGLMGAQVLQKQYDAMLSALEDCKSARVADIRSWKPEQTPLGGNLVLKICKGLTVVASVAFPEVEFLEIAKEGVEIAVKGKETLDKRAEASKDEAEELKKRAEEELDKLLRHARKQVSSTQDKLQKLIEVAAEKLSEDELDELQGMQEPKLIGNFVRDKLGIARGTDVNPSVISAMEITLLNAFNDWVKEDFKSRKLGEASHDVARDGGNSWDAMDLRELYDLKKNPSRFNPNELKEALEAYGKKRGKDGTWAAEQLKNLEDKLEGEFQEQFGTDLMRFVPAKTD